VSEPDLDNLAPIMDRAGHSLTDVDDSRLNAELRELLPVIAMLDRVGPRMGRAPSRENGLFIEPEATGSLGDFLIVRVIGRGGMGVVYEAVQKSLNRRVALKVLPSFSAEDPRRVKRFQVEAEAAACLLHPHIVPVYLIGSENGLHYYAMQFIEGRTLAEIITAIGRGEAGADHFGHVLSSPRMAAELGRQAAEALHFAHEQGTIHRDVKPSNLLIDESGKLWVSDFGLARIAGQVDLTLSGVVLGTLRYMSPEQAFGTRVVVDHRADVYSLGATLFELITLRPVFEGDDRLELLRRIADERPRRPRTLNPAIPRDLETVVLKTLAKDPSERYATALELADDLGRFLQNQPILARRPSLLDRAAKWSRRHGLAMVGAIVMLVALMACLGGAAFWRYETLRRHNIELNSALDLAERNQRTTRRHWYDSQMRLAQQSLSSGQDEFAQELLEGLEPESVGEDLRGFEWRFLRRASHRRVSLLSSRQIRVLNPAFSPDGRTMVSTDDDGGLIFRDLVAGRERGRSQAHGQQYPGRAFSPDGRTLATWHTPDASPSEVMLWDLSTGQRIAPIPGITEVVVGMEFLPGCRTLAIRTINQGKDWSKGKAIFWDLAPDTAYSSFQRSPLDCWTLAYSRDGRRLATAGPSGPITLRAPETNQLLMTIAASLTSICGLALSPDGRTLAATHEKGITTWDTDSGAELGSLKLPIMNSLFFSRDGDRLVAMKVERDEIFLIADASTSPRRVPLEGQSGGEFAVVFSADGKSLAGGGNSLAPTHWDSSTGRKLGEFSGKAGRVYGLVFSADGQSLIFGGEDERARSWHFGHKSESVSQLAGHSAEVWGLAYTPDGTTLISAADDHSIKLWNARGGALRTTLKGHGALVTSLAVSPDGKMLASASFDNKVRLWDLPDGKPRDVLSGHTDRVRAVAFSPDGRVLASAGSDKTVRMWDLAGGKPLRILEGHTDSIRALAFEPSARLLVSSSNDRTIRVWSPEDGRELFSLVCPKQNSALAFSPDGSLLAVGDDWGSVTFWDVATWSRRTSVKGSDVAVWSLSFSPDGRTLAAGCNDAKVRLWDPITGQVMLVLDGHAQRVNAVAFSPDGHTLASASHDGAIKLWHGKAP
jgi:eukaryotic-like serine/threonine-protein kinase